jgi:LPXTG-motif cell wall-anchored protein
MADYSDLDTPSASETPPRRRSGAGNRTFLSLIGILAIVFLAALALMATYLLYIRPRQAGQPVDQAKVLALATSTALAATHDSLTQTETPAATATDSLVIPAQAEAASPTAPGYPAPGGGTQATATPAATSTPLLMDARTATVAALLTEAAQNGLPTSQVTAQAGATATPAVAGTPTPTATSLPKTGFAEDAGLPGLMGIAVALLVVIVLARGLRTRTS